MSENSPKKYYGKYRGTVINNIDPENIGRIMAMVPDALGVIPSSWAMPCMPFGGKQMGLWVVPQIGAKVWIEFEQGDIERPIWTGCWWGTMAEVPAKALAAPPGLPNIVLQSATQNMILISDIPAGPGITLMTVTGAMIVINDLGIVISNGKGASIALTGPTVTINQGALVIT